MLEMISEDAIDRHEGEDAAVLMMRSDTGRCVFWSEQGCAIHAQVGPQLKPTPCIQFPYALTATPSGGRISTQHRCTCRTLGPLPPVRAEEAKACLVDSNGDLKPEHAVFDEVFWSQPFPRLRGMSWSEVADEMHDFHGPTRAAFAARWFGDAIAVLVDRRERTERGRPWADSFERAAERVVDPVSPNKVFGDWIADDIWSMRWTRFGSLARARSELATRLAIARRIAGWLDISTPKQDNISAAEAVMIVDVIGTSDLWEKVQDAIPEP
jgi:hypothetical protein